MKIIYNDGTVAECPAEDELHVIRHSAAHILAQAIKHLYPQAHFAYGPATEKGFHYDVDLGDVKLSDEDFPAIEKEMQSIVKQNLPITPFALSREEAVKLMQERGEIYKVEHIADLPEDADALVLLDVQARGQDVVATVSAAAFAADGTSYTYSKEIPYAFALADGFTATLRAADGTMQAYDEPAALLDAQGERGESAPPPVCDFSFDESGRLLALNERA